MIKYSRNVLNLLFGRIFTNIGDSIFYMVILWYFNEKYESPMLLSLLFIITSMIDIFSFLLGPVIDKIRGKFLLVSVSFVQFLLCVLLVIEISVLKERVSYLFGLNLLIFMSVIYIASSIIYPLESKIIPLIVKEDELINVNGLFHVSYKILDVLFDAIAALLVSFFKINVIFIIAGIIFIIAANFYRLIRFEEKYIQKDKESGSFSTYIRDLKEGISELRKKKEILNLFLPLMCVNFFYAIAAIGLPKFSQEYISYNAMGYGGLLVTSSIGGIAGAIFMQIIKIDIKNPEKFISLTFVIAGVSRIFVSFMVIKFPYTVFIFMFITSCAISMMNIMFVSLIQNSVSQEILGRISTLTESIVSLMIPIGSFFGGIILVYYNTLLSQFLFGLALGISSIYYFSKKN